MREDALAGTSLLQAQHDLAQREHHHHHHHQQQHIHQLQHQKLHKKQEENQGDTNSDSVEVVTQVVATLSVIQQIDVDSNGVTFSSLLIPATTDSSPTLTDSLPTATEASSSSVNTPASTVPSAAAGAQSSNTSGQSSLSTSSSQSATFAPTSTPSISSSFPSLLVSSNATTLISSSSSFSHNTLSNSTRSSSSTSKSSSTSRSSLTYLTSSGSFTTSDDSTTVSASSYYSSSSSPQPTLTSTGDSAFGTPGGASIRSGSSTGSASGASSSSTGTSGNLSGSESEPATPTPVIIGSVVSSVAGAAVIFLALLFIWRWRKRNRNMLSLASGPPGEGVDTMTGGAPSQPSGGMVERSSFINTVPAALASLTGYKRYSQKTERTVSSTAGSEIGFYRVSGRKLPSVLQSGGDGYGGGLGHLNENTLSGSSFYRDSQGFYGGPGSPSFPPVGMSTQRDSGIPVMRPSPARTPVTEHGPFASVPPPLDPPTRPDSLGRSHPSQDGSHASKFTEEV